jgi:hypothetical protein
MAGTDTLIELAKARRTYYKLSKKTVVPDSRIEELVNAAILHIPSSLNTQSTRLVVLLHDQHEKLWDIVFDSFAALVKTSSIQEELWNTTLKPKLAGMKPAYGTVSRLSQRNHLAWLTLCYFRSCSTRIPPIWSPCRRNLPSTRTTSANGWSTRVPCTSTSVCQTQDADILPGRKLTHLTSLDRSRVPRIWRQPTTLQPHNRRPRRQRVEYPQGLEAHLADGFWLY